MYLVADATKACGLDELVVAGGGVRNPTLMRRIAELSAPARVRLIDEFGLPAQGKEAYLFALLGYLTVHGLPASIPSATGASAGSILWDVSDYTAQGIDVDGLSRTMDLGVTSGTLVDLRGETVAVDSLTAQALHLRVGDQFTGWYGDGVPTRLAVVAIYRRGLGFASLTLPHDVLARHTDTGRDDTVFVTTAPGAAGVAQAMRVELARTAPVRRSLRDRPTRLA